MSCSAAVTGAEVKDGASLVLATVMVKDWLSDAPRASVTDSTTEALPTCWFMGVPASVAVPSPLSVSVIHSGADRVVMVLVSPASGSEVVMA